jgi:hypothetical protein
LPKEKGLVISLLRIGLSGFIMAKKKELYSFYDIILVRSSMEDLQF